jgi:hypothetical protein
VVVEGVVIVEGVVVVVVEGVVVEGVVEVVEAVAADQRHQRSKEVKMFQLKPVNKSKPQ